MACLTRARIGSVSIKTSCPTTSLEWMDVGFMTVSPSGLMEVPRARTLQMASISPPQQHNVRSAATMCAS